MNQPSPTSPSETLTVAAADGYPLAATRFATVGTPRAQLIVASATGVPQGFYRRFAEHAAARGFAVTTFDYRGIGRSAPASLDGFGGDFLDWARLDLAAVVEAVAAHAGTHTPILLVGHSFGGQALGLLPEPERIAAMAAFGTGAGWHGWMPPLERIKVQFMWRVVGPWLVRRHGYLAWGRLGMGADLPLGVYRQWKGWCRFRRYFFDDPAMRATALGFARVTAPILAINARDDRWAPPASRDAFMQGYSAAPWVARDVDDLKLGHMGYFRAHAEPLWTSTLDWFEEQLRRSPPPARSRTAAASAGATGSPGLTSSG